MLSTTPKPLESHISTSDDSETKLGIYLKKLQDADHKLGNLHTEYMLNIQALNHQYSALLSQIHLATYRSSQLQRDAEIHIKWLEHFLSVANSKMAFFNQRIHLTEMRESLINSSKENLKTSLEKIMAEGTNEALGILRGYTIPPEVVLRTASVIVALLDVFVDSIPDKPFGTSDIATSSILDMGVPVKLANDANIPNQSEYHKVEFSDRQEKDPNAAEYKDYHAESIASSIDLPIGLSTYQTFCLIISHNYFKHFLRSRLEKIPQKTECLLMAPKIALDTWCLDGSLSIDNTGEFSLLLQGFAEWLHALRYYLLVQYVVRPISPEVLKLSISNFRQLSQPENDFGIQDHNFYLTKEAVNSDGATEISEKSTIMSYESPEKIENSSLQTQLLYWKNKLAKETESIQSNVDRIGALNLEKSRQALKMCKAYDQLMNEVQDDHFNMEEDFMAEFRRLTSSQ